MNQKMGTKKLNTDAVIFSSQFGYGDAGSDRTTPEIVGGKASGLLKLPEAWTLPFFVLPTSFHDALRLSKEHAAVPDISQVFSSLRKDHGAWLDFLTDNGKYALIFRSSAEHETLAERGQYHSTPTGGRLLFDDFCETVWQVIDQTTQNSPDIRLAIIVQRYLKMEIFGHLSNETHLMPTRDRWVVEYKDGHQDIRENINSRRAEIADQNNPLSRINLTNLKRVMRKIGKWGNELYTERMHFEWGLKEDRLWLLQLDQEQEDRVGVDPRVLLNTDRPRFDGEPNLKLKFFKRFKPGHQTPWQKLRNINDFCVDDDPPKHRMFYCPGTQIERVISNKKELRQLQKEIKNLTEGYAVIRTDVKNQDEPQHNPNTCISVEVTSEGLELKLIEKSDNTIRPMQQIELNFDNDKK